MLEQLIRAALEECARRRRFPPGREQAVVIQKDKEGRCGNDSS